MSPSKRTIPPPPKLGERNKGGRSSSYDPDTYPELAKKLCAEFGADDKGLAQIFDVTTTTIDNWKNEHKEFFGSIREGKDLYDCKNVEISLLQRALGYDYIETKVEEITLSQGKGKAKISVPATKTTTINKIVPPSTTAAIFWLVNRQPQRWQHLQKTEFNHKGKVFSEVNHKGKVKIDDSPERAQIVFQEMLKAGGIDPFLLLGTDKGAQTQTH